MCRHVTAETTITIRAHINVARGTRTQPRRCLEVTIHSRKPELRIAQVRESTPCLLYAPEAPYALDACSRFWWSKMIIATWSPVNLILANFFNVNLRCTISFAFREKLQNDSEEEHQTTRVKRQPLYSAKMPTSGRIAQEPSLMVKYMAWKAHLFVMFAAKVTFCRLHAFVASPMDNISPSTFMMCTLQLAADGCSNTATAILPAMATISPTMLPYASQERPK